MLKSFLLTAVVTLSGLLAGCSGQRVLNTLTTDDGYQITSNVVFDAATGMDLDVYRPNEARNAPVVVFFYGGRWQSGRKEDYKFVGQALAARGFVAVLPNYRLYPQVRFPDFLIDNARAVRWAHDNANRYGGDAGKIVLMGHSSGAYNAAMLALNPEYLKQGGADRGWLRGVIGMAGPYDFLPLTDPDLRDLFGDPANYDRTQPVLYPDGRNPPMLLLHGMNDEVVFAKNTETLAARIKNSNGPVETVLYPKMSHTRIIASLSSRVQSTSDVMLHVNEFVKRVTSTRAAPEQPGGLQTIVPQP